VIFLGLFLSARDPLQKLVPPDLLLRLDPVAGLVATLSARVLVAAFWPALLVLGLTVALGRSFCGWICPLGSCLDGWDHLLPSGKQRGDRRWKYLIFLCLIPLALFSIQASWLLDPLVIFTRSLALVIYPLTVWGINSLVNAAFNWRLTDRAALGLSDALQGWLLPAAPVQTALLFTTLIIFAGILLLDQFGRRYWCRNLCPLGAFLGFIARFSPFGRGVSSECTSCTICAEDCRMDAIENNFIRTRRGECILCMECSQNCPTEATTYNWHQQKGGQEALNLGRRQLLGSLGTAVIIGGAWRSGLQNRTTQGYLIRPPGSLPEDQFLDLCLRCGECVKACSSTGRCLQPADLTTGWERLWTPAARMREGYCEYSCTLCGQVCPSGAIKPLLEIAKKTTVIGLAYINRSRCIPWERGEDCIVCEEHCPVSKKAVIFRRGEVELPGGIKTGVKLPYVDRELCLGCGICETKCPVQGEAAIRITNEGEQRVV
jgi:MauM/NapG family ferredoxin protein